MTLATRSVYPVLPRARGAPCTSPRPLPDASHLGVWEDQLDTDEAATTLQRGISAHPLPQRVLATTLNAGLEEIVLILVEPGAGSSGFHVVDESVVQSVSGTVRGSPNRGITLASKPVITVTRSSVIVTTSSP
jgi:hypothetical protein